MFAVVFQQITQALQQTLLQAIKIKIKKFNMELPKSALYYTAQGTIPSNSPTP